MSTPRAAVPSDRITVVKLELERCSGRERVSNDDRLELPCEILHPRCGRRRPDREERGSGAGAPHRGGANAPTTPAADPVLRERGITVVQDILANAGGVIVSYFDWVQDLHFHFWKEDEVNRRLRDVIQGEEAPRPARNSANSSRLKTG